MGAKHSKQDDILKFTRKRQVGNVPMPISTILQVKDLFDDPENPGLPNLTKFKYHLENEGRLGHELVNLLIEMVNKILKKEPNVLKIESPVNIVGDIHGQFYDLLTIMSLGGSPDDFKYLFMGDFVDRGVFAFECVCYLYALKIRYPSRFFMIRGNHESRHLTRFFTFKDECVLKSNEGTYENFMYSFDNLPIAAVVDSKFFCVHGGLSPNFNLIDELEKEDRFKEIPKHGVLCDLTWSDPIENFDSTTENKYESYFVYNSSRGCSYNYTQQAVERFLRENNLISVIRAHQVQREGIHLSPCFLNDKKTSIGFPSLISIFSAPNYCDVYQNKAAIIQCTKEQFSIKIFTASEHPFVLPNFQNGFTWSLPFIFEKFSALLLFILNQISDEEVDLADDKHINKIINSLFDKAKDSRQPGLLNKLKKYKDNYKKENEINNSDLRLGSLTPNNRLRRRSSDADREKLANLETKGVESFEDANNLDSLQYKIVNSDEENSDT